jgi:hypothetical protein
MDSIVECCSEGDLYECHCSCHEDRARGLMAEHVVPCCEMAPCGLRIIAGCMQMHISQCEKCRTVGEQATGVLISLITLS